MHTESGRVEREYCIIDSNQKYLRIFFMFQDYCAVSDVPVLGRWTAKHSVIYERTYKKCIYFHQFKGDNNL